MPRNRPAIGLVYAQAAEHINLIRELHNPSVIAVVSVSESLLRAARGVVAPAIGIHDTFSEVLADGGAPIRMGSADVVFCDTVTLARINHRRKIPYRLVAPECLEHLEASLRPS